MMVQLGYDTRHGMAPLKFEYDKVWSRVCG